MDDTFCNMLSWLKTTVGPLMIGLVGIALTAFVQRTAQILADMFWGLFSKREQREAKESKIQKAKRKQRKRKNVRHEGLSERDLRVQHPFEKP